MTWLRLEVKNMCEKKLKSTSTYSAYFSTFTVKYWSACNWIQKILIMKKWALLQYSVAFDTCWVEWKNEGIQCWRGITKSNLLLTNRWKNKFILYMLWYFSKVIYLYKILFWKKDRSREQGKLIRYLYLFIYLLLKYF